MKHLALIVIALACAPSVARATTSDLLLREALAIEVVISGEVPKDRSEQRLDDAERRLAELRSQLRTDDPLRARATMIAGLAAAVRSGNVAARPVPEAVRSNGLLTLDRDSAKRCPDAITLPVGQPLTVAVGAGDAFWVRVNGILADGVSVSTWGSTVDPRLEAYADCRLASGTPTLQVEDSIGVQAELTLPTHEQKSWFVRVSVGAGAGRLALSAVSSAVIGGRVTRSATGLAIPSVQVSLFEVVNSVPQFRTSTITAADGRFGFGGVPAGIYALRTSSLGGLQPVLFEAYQGHRCRIDTALSISSCGSAPGGTYTPVMVSGSTVAPIDFALADAGTLVGTILSSAGGTVPFATVAMYASDGSYLTQATADANGRYRLIGVPDSAIRIEASATDHARTRFDGVECGSTQPGSCPPGSGTPISVAPGSTARVDMTIRKLQFVEVDVSIDGSPIFPPSSGAFYPVTLQLLNESGGVVASANASGSSPRVRVGPVGPGSYKLSAFGQQTFPQLYPDIGCATDCVAELALGTPITVVSGSVGPVVAMNLRSLPRIEGRVIEEGTGSPVSGASVRLMSDSGFVSRQTATRQDGGYVIDNVLAGSYRLRFSSDQHEDEGYDGASCLGVPISDVCPGSTPIAIDRNSGNRTIDASLRRSGSISGGFTVNGGPSEQGPFFTVMTLGGTIVMESSARSLPGGRYRLDDVPVGTWLVASGGSFASIDIPQIYSGINCTPGVGVSACPIASATPVTVGSGQVVADIDFAVRRMGARSVRVVDDLTGTPIPGIIVDTWDTVGRQVDTRTTDSNGRALVFVNATGNPPRDYALSTDNSMGYVNEVHQGISCPFGSVFFGTCGLTGYTPVSLPAPVDAPEITFGLSRSPLIFRDGFEQ